MEDFVYFSTNPDVELDFETKFGSVTPVDFMGPVTFFLGIKFQWRRTLDQLACHLSQQAFIESLLTQVNFHPDSTTSKASPYRSGIPVDSVPNENIPQHQRSCLESLLRQIFGSLNWLLQATQPNLTTIANTNPTLLWVISELHNTFSNT